MGPDQKLDTFDPPFTSLTLTSVARRPIRHTLLVVFLLAAWTRSLPARDLRVESAGESQRSRERRRGEKQPKVEPSVVGGAGPARMTSACELGKPRGQDANLVSTS